MNTNAWIIRRNTPESRLLSRIGIDREELYVVKWKGKMQSRGGFGRKPIEWRISDRSELEKLSNGLIEIIGRKPKAKLSLIEKKTLDRAHKIITSFYKKDKEEQKLDDFKKKRTNTIVFLISKLYPCASNREILDNLVDVNEISLTYSGEIIELIESDLRSKINIWKDSRASFVSTSLEVMSELEKL